MNKFRKLLDWLSWILILSGILAFTIYYHNWILLSLIIVSVALFCGFIYIMGMGLESGFRNKFPLDYLMHLSTEIDFFNEKGYQLIEYIEPGSEHPGIVLQKENSPDVKIILKAPIKPSDYSVDVIVMKDPEISINYLVTTPLETKIEKLNELCEIV